MKIAIPSMDGSTISQHFGRCKTFLIFELEGGRIAGRELRENGQGCGGHSHEEGGASHQGDTHGGFVRLLSDCQVVIAKGIGGGAMQALRGAGIRVALVQDDCSPEEALLRLAGGGLSESGAAACTCHH
jgi:predicted Fe-Mo cluster-binding NifX family protein